MSTAPGRVLVVTNDFPPRHGGIESFAREVVTRLPPGSAVVHTARQDGGVAVDAGLAELGVPVVRDPARLLLPTPALAGRLAATARAHGCDRAWFVAAAPLGLLAPAVRRAGAVRVVATTHGHEVWWARVPLARAALRAVAAHSDVLTVLGPATGAVVTAALPGRLRQRVRVLAPGVDAGAYTGGDGTAVRARHGLGERSVVVCVSRLVARKGQDVLLRALPAVRARVPGAALLLVGGGPRAGALARAVERAGLGRDVVLTGPVPDAELADHYAAGDVFAMPARDRWGGLETEGLGICYLEAAAAGLPVVAGRSGGTQEALRDGLTGVLVDGRDVAAVAAALVALLTDRARASAMGAAGRRWVAAEQGWQQRADTLAALLGLLPGAARPVPGAAPGAAPAGQRS